MRDLGVAMRRIAKATIASAVCLTSTVGGLAVMAAPASAGGWGCNHVTGTTTGLVTLKSCNGTGYGTLPGATFVGSNTGTVTWIHRRTVTSATISITTTENPTRNQGYSAFCVRKGYGLLYDVTGTVTSSNSPYIGNGTHVSAELCIDYSTGSIRQTHYGGMNL
jgi:hypothetical protein